MRKIIFLAVGGLMIGLATPVYSAQDDREKGAQSVALEELLSRYEPSGDARRCLQSRSIRSSKPLDDWHIVFEMPGGRLYLNRLNSRCARLGREKRFSYRSWSSSLCRGQIIEVLDSFGREWASCSLGDFEELSEKPKAESGDDALVDTRKQPD